MLIEWIRSAFVKKPVSTNIIDFNAAREAKLAKQAVEVVPAQEKKAYSFRDICGDSSP